MPVQTPTADILWVYNQYDTAPPLRIAVTNDDGSPMDLTGATVTIDIAYGSADHHYSPYRRIVTDGPCGTVPLEGDIFYHLQPHDLDTPGSYHVRFTIHWAEGTKQAIPPDWPLALRVHARIGGPA